MIVKDQIVGTIMLDAAKRDISSRDLRLLQIFAEYAGIAIENGRLFYDVIKSDHEVKSAHQKLLKAERVAVLGQMAISINHEINNPLCCIGLISQTIKRELKNRDPKLIPLLHDLDQDVNRIQEVTRKLATLRHTPLTEYLPNQYMIDLK